MASFTGAVIVCVNDSANAPQIRTLKVSTSAEQSHQSHHREITPTQSIKTKGSILLLVTIK